VVGRTDQPLSARIELDLTEFVSGRCVITVRPHRAAELQVEGSSLWITAAQLPELARVVLEAIASGKEQGVALLNDIYEDTLRKAAERAEKRSSPPKKVRPPVSLTRMAS
jgi:hypothetical protein